jgi:hypothetical protein
MKSRGMRNPFRIFVAFLNSTDHLGDLSIDVRIILKFIWKERCECRLHSTGLGHGSVVGCTERDNEPSGFTKGGAFLTEYQLLNDCFVF